MKQGIDVSRYQGEIDWESVKKSGVEFAILRLGFGKDFANQDDACFLYNAKECERLGIPYGTYLYSYAGNTADAASEAAHALRLLKGRTPVYPLFYDLEEENNLQGGKQGVLAIAKCFVQKIEAGGFSAGIYACKSWHETYLTDPWFDTLPRWVAQYYSRCTLKKRWDIWQYSASGKVDGIAGKVDMDRMEEFCFCYPACRYEGCSVAEALASVGVDASYAFRKKIAAKNSIKDYRGTAEQNLFMLALLKEGRLIRV